MSAEERRLSASALIPAAGSGVRMGGERKQYRTLGGEPLLLRTVRAVLGCPVIEEVVVAVPAGEEDRVSTMLQQVRTSAFLLVTAGGRSRAESVRRALTRTSTSMGLVLVHDAVRPFVTAEAVTAVLDAAARFGAASLAIPVSDTLRRGADGYFGDSLDRADLYRVQTPQAFRREVLIDAFERAGHAAETATDEASLVWEAGVPVRIVPGSSLNVKLTTPDDWQLALMLRERWDRAHPGSA